MRVILQRVSEAKVEVEGSVIGKIALGLLLLVGIEENDTEEDMDWLIGKISKMRIFNDAAGKMNLSVSEVKGSVLSISQFTLHASIKKGNRPSFIKSAKPDYAEPLYLEFNRRMEIELNQEIQSGKFGADMQVSLVNDGPVTIFLDSKNKE